MPESSQSVRMGEPGAGGIVLGCDRVGRIGLLLHFVVHGGLCHPADAHATPAGDGHVLNEGLLEGGLGLEFFEESVDERKKAIRGLGLENDSVGEHAMLTRSRSRYGALGIRPDRFTVFGVGVSRFRSSSSGSSTLTRRGAVSLIEFEKADGGAKQGDTDVDCFQPRRVEAILNNRVIPFCGIHRLPPIPLYRLFLPVPPAVCSKIRLRPIATTLYSRRGRSRDPR